jgi:hypothetical protein
MVLIDGVALKYDYKAFVAAISYRKRAIPLMFKAYTNQQIRDMQYLSENWIVWKFMDQIYDSVIIDRIRDAWVNLRVNPWFSLTHVRFYNINEACL